MLQSPLEVGCPAAVFLEIDRFNALELRKGSGGHEQNAPRTVRPVFFQTMNKKRPAVRKTVP